MSKIFLSKEEQNIVVFKFLKALPYRARLGICFCMLLIGFLIQAFFIDFFIVGCVILFVGNLFLLVDGYDNRVKFGAFDPGAKWDKVEKEKFAQLIEMQKKMKKWDRSAIDCSSGCGCSMMLVVLAAGAGLIFLGEDMDNKAIFVLGIDLILLLLPHWLTGLRRVSTVVNIGLAKKINVIQEVVADCKTALGENGVEYYMLLSGKGDIKVPKDIKFKVDMKGHHPDFLGLYGQVVMNDVQGTLYPYFYTVLVAKKGYGMEIQKGNVVGIGSNPSAELPGFLSKLLPIPKGPSVTKSLKKQKDVEVLVIRQTTTKQSGYNTDRVVAKNIFLTGLNSAKVNAYKKG